MDREDLSVMPATPAPLEEDPLAHLPDIRKHYFLMSITFKAHITIFQL